MKTKSIFTKTLLSVICAFALTFGLFFISPSALKASASEIDMTLVKIDESGNIDANGEYVEFGSYPQSRVTDDNLIVILTLAAGNTSLSNVQSTWTSYGYPLVVKNENEPAFNDTQTQFMWYKDLTLDDSAYGGKYRAFVFSEYRKCINNSGTFQQDNGYEVSTAENVIVYWFKFEPIKWKILSEENGNALLFSTVILDSHYINSSYGNDYATGDGISWLNGTFYNTAFNANEQAYVKNTSVEGTNAKLFYLSLDELKNTAYGFAADENSADPARKRVGTDYAKSQGLYGKEYWTRTPNEHGSNDKTETIFNDGSKSDCNCYSTYIGVVPALNVSMPEQPHLHNACGEASCSHDGHSSLSYTALDQETFNSFSNNGRYEVPDGNYYLTEDITVSNTGIAFYTVNLCLNGYSLNVNGGGSFLITFSSEYTLTIGNCSQTESSVNVEYAYGNLNLYDNVVYNFSTLQNGIADELNVFGGTVNSNGIGVEGGGKMIIGDATINCENVVVLVYASQNDTPEKVVLDLSGYKGEKLNVTLYMEEAPGGYGVLGTFEKVNIIKINSACSYEENGYIMTVDHHDYDNACDADCNVCGYERNINHAYDTDCDTDCNECGAVRTVEPHSYDNGCDTDCNKCGAVRAFEGHSYDNDCDTDCNECGEIRTVEPHSYTADCDENCNKCGAVRQPLIDHTFDGDCDRTCDACENIRTVTAEHTYTNECDYVCDVCGHEGEEKAHEYDDNLDKTCNKCGEERILEFDLYVLGEQITEFNMDDIMGDSEEKGGVPSLSYDPVTNTLTLNNANLFIEGRDIYLIDSFDYDYDYDIDINIHLIGANVIEVNGDSPTAIYGKNITFTAEEGATLLINAIDEANLNSNAIFASGGLNFLGGEVTINSDFPIFARAINALSITASVEKNATQLFEATITQTDIYEMCVTVDGEMAKTVKVIGGGELVEYYNLTVAGTMVTSLNADNIVSEYLLAGSISYDAETNTLILDNAEIVYSGTEISAIDSYDYGLYEYVDLNIHFKGQNYIQVSGNFVSAISAANLKFTSEKQSVLYIFSNGEGYGGCGIYAKGSIDFTNSNVVIMADNRPIVMAGELIGNCDIKGSADIQADLNSLAPATFDKESDVKVLVVEDGPALIVHVKGLGKSYNLLVAGKEVYEGNAHDIFDDLLYGEEPTAVYDAESNTLILNNATIGFETTSTPAIMSGKLNENEFEMFDLNIHLIGQNMIFVEGVGSAGICANNLTISAENEALLLLQISDQYNRATGISLRGKFNVKGGIIFIVANKAIVAYDEISAQGFGFYGSIDQNEMELQEATVGYFDDGGSSVYSVFIGEPSIETAVSILQISHQHEWSKDMTSDDKAHWHECLNEGCHVKNNESKEGYELHQPEENGEFCEICGAEVPQYYCNIYVMEIQINEINAHDVLGDSDQNGGVPSVSYDKETNVLTLNNARLEMTGDGKYVIDAYDYELGEYQDLNIHLIGENFIIVTGGFATGIDGKTITVTAEEGAKLNILLKSENSYAWGISADELILKNGEIYISSSKEALNISGGITANGYEVYASLDEEATELQEATFGVYEVEDYVAYSVFIGDPADETFAKTVRLVHVHAPNADDGDCRTEITCSHCASVTTAGNPDHVPNADDGDCTTAITCSHCASVITEGRPAHDFNGEYLTDETHHWNKCLNCDVHSSKGEHSLDENGVCELCEFGKVEEPDGLSGGAIAGIAVGSAAGLGIIAFVIFWFVIKKNSFADLLKIFKK